jgi:ectoine hydroxylase-related dioxygenase (phytanoyl-CoA dioxygenase family)
MPHRLGSQDVDRYRREGYVVFQQPVFSPAKFERLRQAFEEDLARYGEDDLDVIHFRDERLLELLLSDEVLDLVEPLVGPDIGLWSSHFISKPPRTGKSTPWHDDSHYWEGKVSAAEGICTVWLAIDDARRENGCMQVVPGTHLTPVKAYVAADRATGIFPDEIPRDDVDVSRAVALELEPGQCSLHEARIVHGAEANTSDRRRAGYTMRYFPTTTRITYPGHRVWLARGADRAGNRYEN